jgi:hypothetical protein
MSLDSAGVERRDGVVAVSIRESDSSPVAAPGVAVWSLYSSPRSRRGTGELELAQGRWAHTCSDRRGARRWRRARAGLAPIPFGGQSSEDCSQTSRPESNRHLGLSDRTFARGPVHTGALTLPATVIVSLRRPLRRAARTAVTAAAACVVEVVAAVLAWRSGPVGNYVTHELGPSLSLGSPDDRLPNAAWAVIAAFSAYSCFVIVLCAGSALVRLIGVHAGDEEEREHAPRTPAHGVVTTFSLLTIALMFVGGRSTSRSTTATSCRSFPVAAFVMVEEDFVRLHSDDLRCGELGRVRSTLVFDERRGLRRTRPARSVGPRRIRYRSIEDRRWSDWVGFHWGAAACTQ